eukprot:GFUD01016429.1.p1 GENE.GFUD01016429.1~~GFUD01016429.1.p1  ORF type:complete len:106 (+),score=35.32 GFUD01016429.1:110-427(+)
MGLKKLTELKASELSTELKRAGLAVTGGKFNDEREAILRLSTYLIDKGEDPTSYEFSIDESEKDETTAVKNDKEELGLMNNEARQKLLAKIVRLERSYFTQGRGL